MGLGSVLQESVGSGSLLRIVEQGFGRNEEKRPLDPEKDYLRASGVYRMCPREEVICALDNIVRPDIVEPGLNLTFLHGTALHWAVQNKLLGPLGVLYGTWRCEACGCVHGAPPEKVVDYDWVVPMPKACAKCGSRDLNFIEPAFIDHGIRLTGHTDGILVIPGLAGKGILEVKSVGARHAREAKVAPMIEHMTQANIYMMFTGLKWAKLFYWFKSEAGMSMLAEHHIDRDEEQIQHIRDAVASVWSGIRTKTLPERICATQTCPRASNCPVAARCFQP